MTGTQTIVVNKKNNITLIKFLAAIFITWSHLGVMFPDGFKGLITGGAIGDGLFFFCSGYTLFLGRKDGFFNWYKRRVSRIYPTIIMWALLSSVFFLWEWNVTDIITTPRYWFIPCIMVYYAIFYIIRSIVEYLNKTKGVDMRKSLIGIFAFTAIVITICSFFVLDMTHSVMYAQVSFMRIYYFIFMLLGACVSVCDPNSRTKESKWMYLGFTVVFLVLYYICMAIYKIGSWWCQFQMISLVPLLFVIYYLHKLCGCTVMKSLMDKRYIGWIIILVSNLTLEIYMVQYALFTDRFNNLWPLNIICVYLAIFMVAFFLKISSRLFLQIFSKETINWRELIEIK